VGHADHDLFDAELRPALDDEVEQRDRALAALEREALLLRVGLWMNCSQTSASVSFARMWSWRSR
jgi:hypothetical protein